MAHGRTRRGCPRRSRRCSTRTASRSPTSISMRWPRARLVHRPAHRDRDHPGAGVRAGAAGRRDPALDALAHADSLDAPPGTLVAAWTDAHRGDVFAGLCRVTDAAPFSRERLVGIEGPMVGPPAVTLARWAAQHGTLPERFAGDGAVLYCAVILAAAPSARVVEAPLLAGTIGRLARARRAEAVDPGTVRALHVRRPDAEIARDEKLRVHEIDSKAH